MIREPFRYVDSYGEVTYAATYSVIRIDMRDGSAVWVEDGTPLTDDERQQLWAASVNA